MDHLAKVSIKMVSLLTTFHTFNSCCLIHEEPPQARWPTTPVYVLEAKSQKSRCGLDSFIKLVDGCPLSRHMVIRLCFSIQIFPLTKNVYIPD